MITLTCLLLALSALMVSCTPRALYEPKYAVAHVIVGNTWSYTYTNWFSDITLAASKGLDGFVLNVGRDSWQPAKVADAFAAAQNFDPNFKLFMSFDMTSLPCSSGFDVTTLRKYISDYRFHPNSLLYNGKVVVSTFAGEYCFFGTSSLNEGWRSVVKNDFQTYFIPSFFVNPSEFSTLDVIDGAFNWNSGWPSGDNAINFNSDRDYIQNLHGRSYMAGVSPWFFTHYGPDTYNKNFIYRGDDWLFAQRWELLIQNRQSIDIAQVISWNDFGESHYVGPIEGSQSDSQAWTTGFEHQAWLDLMQIYISEFKTGKSKAISNDRIFLWARLYPAEAEANDRVGKPANWQWTEDYLWAVVLLTSPAQVTLSCGSSTSTSALMGGLHKLKLRLEYDCNVSAQISRDSGEDSEGEGSSWTGESPLESTGFTFKPAGFKFSRNPPNYNFNAFVAASSP